MDKSVIFPQNLRDRIGEGVVQKRNPDFEFEEEWGRARETEYLVTRDYLSRWAADIINILEKYLKNKSIEIPDNPAILYGGDYSQIEDNIIEILEELIEEKKAEFKRNHEFEEDEVMEE